MTMIYSASTGAWYAKSVHASIPDDAIDVTDDEYRVLLDEHSKGRPYAVVGGKVTAVDAPPPTDDELSAILRSKRNELLTIADRVINTAEDIGRDAGEWRKWRVTLRNLPASDGWPKVALPATPTDQLASTKDQFAIEAIIGTS
jgi:hypothetical protein